VPPLSDLPGDFADSSEEADSRYRATIDKDPFPEITAALLNSADVEDYVRATGMIFPFDRACLKACSYKVSIGGRYLYWDEHGRERFRQLKTGEGITLPPNSIAFVTTKEFFRLPRYIAARFNLSITNVHRGILLGTGPLVDPGFWGRLLIPLHNLTLNEYTFRSGERFAWFEFTKVSPNYWDEGYEKSGSQRKGSYTPFDPDKTEIQPEEYLNRAHPKPIRSSIPDALERSAKSAENARDENRKLRNRLSTIGVIAFLAAAYGGYQLVLSSNERFDGIMHSVADSQREMGTIATQSSVREEKLSSLERRLDEVASNLDSFTQDLGGLDPSKIQQQLDELRTALSRLQSDSSERPEQRE
jgi:deoxycytidine triphosphate deaminase